MRRASASRAGWRSCHRPAATARSRPRAEPDPRAGMRLRAAPALWPATGCHGCARLGLSLRSKASRPRRGSRPPVPPLTTCRGLRALEAGGASRRFHRIPVRGLRIFLGEHAGQAGQRQYQGVNVVNLLGQAICAFQRCARVREITPLGMEKAQLRVRSAHQQRARLREHLDRLHEQRARFIELARAHERLGLVGHRKRAEQVLACARANRQIGLTIAPRSPPLRQSASSSSRECEPVARSLRPSWTRSARSGNGARSVPGLPAGRGQSYCDMRGGTGGGVATGFRLPERDIGHPLCLADLASAPQSGAQPGCDERMCARAGSSL